MLTGHVMHEAAFLFLAHLYKTNFCFLFFAFRFFYVCLSLRCVKLGFRFLLSLHFFISSSFCYPRNGSKGSPALLCGVASFNAYECCVSLTG